MSFQTKWGGLDTNTLIPAKQRLRDQTQHTRYVHLYIHIFFYIYIYIYIYYIH